MNANGAESALQLTKDAQLELLIRDYGEKIIQLAYLMVRDRGIAEDITQEVFIKAYRGLHDFRGESNVKTWLYRIAINESKKYLRSWSFRHIFSTFVPKSEKLQDPVDHEDTESAVIKKMGKAEIAEKVMAMSPQYRQVLTLHYYEDLSIREVAQVLDVSEDAVRTKLSRARKQFKALMEKEGMEWI